MSTIVPSQVAQLIWTLEVELSCSQPIFSRVATETCGTTSPEKDEITRVATIKV